MDFTFVNMKTQVINGISGFEFSTPAGVYDWATPQNQNAPQDWELWNIPPQISPNTIELPPVFDYEFLAPEGDDSEMISISWSGEINTDPCVWLWYVQEFRKLNRHYKLTNTNPVGNPQFESVFPLPRPNAYTRSEYQNLINKLFFDDVSDLPEAQAQNFIRFRNFMGQINNVFTDIADVAVSMGEFENMSPQSVLQTFLPFDFSTGEQLSVTQLYDQLQGIIDTFNSVTWSSRADSYRLYKAGLYAYNNLSAAYGTGQTWLPWGAYVGQRPSFWQRLWSGIKKVFPGLVLGRNSALVLIEFNVRNVAARLDTRRGEKLKRTWEGFGGNYSALLNRIDSGKDKAPFLGDPAIISTAIIVGTPVLLALVRAVLDDDFDLNDALAGLADVAQNSATAYCEEYRNQLAQMIAGYAEDNTPAEVQALISQAVGSAGINIADCGDLVGQAFAAAGFSPDDDDRASGVPPGPPAGIPTTTEQTGAKSSFALPLFAGAGIFVLLQSTK